MGIYPSKPSRETGSHPSLTAPNHPIESSAAVVTMNQDIAFMVCAELYHSGWGRDLVAAAQTSILWNVAATPWLYRSLSLDFDLSKSLLTARLLKSLQETGNGRPVYRHFLQHLTIKMASTEGDSSRRRLKSGVLKVLARLIPLLSMLNSFTWEVPEPMPKSLLEALNNHPKLSNQAALFTCWGLNEERQYLESLGTAANLSDLVIDFRPRLRVPLGRLGELMFYQKQLLLRQQNLKSLTIKYRYNNCVMLIAQIVMDGQERLPSIERLSLERYSFSLDNGGIQFHMNAPSLRSLTLVACRNWHLLLGIPEMKLSQLIILGPKWKMDPWSAVPERIVLQSFLCKGHDFEQLELESLGISHAIIGVIIKSNGSAIRKLRIHNFEHAVLLGGAQPVPQFKSLPSHIILSICKHCPHLRSLELDLTETDITGHTDAARTLETFLTLKHLQINTQLSAPAIDPDNPYMAVVRVRNLACDIWSRSLETFRLVTRSLARDGTQLDGNGSWLATRIFDDLDVDEWDVEIIDEIAAAAERKLRGWARAVDVRFDPPTDRQERLQWEKKLGKEIEVAGAKALKALK